MNFASIATGTFILLKALDVYSTHINFQKYGGGTDIEANPIMKYVLDTFGWTGAIVLFFLTSCFLYVGLYRYQESSLVRISMCILLVGTGLVVTSNFLVYLFI